MSVASQAVAHPSFLTRPDRIAIASCAASLIIGILLPYPATKFVLAAGLGAVFLYLSMRCFYLAVAFFCFLMPLQVLVPNSSYFLRGANLQTAFLLLFLASAMRASQHADSRAPAPDRPNPVLLPLAGLFLTVVASAAHSSLIHGMGFIDLMSRVKNWFAYSLLAVLAYRWITDRREKLFVLSTILAVTVFNAAYSMRDIFMNPSLNIASNRAISLIVIQPNLYAGFLVLYSFFFLSLLVAYPLTRTGKLLVGGGAALVLINLVYTLSRGAWLAFMAAALFISVARARKLLIPLLIVAGALYLWLPDVATSRFQSGFEGEYDPRFLTEENVTVDEAASRIVQWKNFLPLLVEHPVFGVGFGRFGFTIYQKRIDEKARSAHSSVIEIGIEEGLIGLGFYAALLFVIFTGASQIFSRSADPVDQSLAIGLMAATVALLVLDLTGTRFRNSNIMAFFWILCGMTLNAPLSPPGAPGRGGAPDTRKAPA
ncbi:MAG: O-antigen ligase family protein [Acidobacteriota bacterium]